MAINRQNILPKGHVLNSGSYTYVIEEVLGCGGFGITYLAFASVKVGNVSVLGKFAIKEHFVSSDCEREQDTSRVVYSNPARERVESSRKDFIAEAKRLHKVGINHSNIVKVNEVFEANNTAYYVMEYLQGFSLRSYVKQKKALAEKEMWNIMCPVIDAVSYLHANRMTHLDIKPDNIMLTKDERGNLRPVLIDFGLSKHYDKNGKPTSTINTLGCSDGYAPVEQYAGITTFSPSADIYALGATMWFCLMGHDPKKSTDTDEGQLNRLLPSYISSSTKEAIKYACSSNRNQRSIRIPSDFHSDEKNIETFLSGDSDDSIPTVRINTIVITKKKFKQLILLFLALCVLVGFVIVLMKVWPNSVSKDDQEKIISDGEQSEKQKQEDTSLIEIATIPDNFVLVPAGVLKDVIEFSQTASGYGPDLKYDISMDSLYIDKFELTQKEYERVMGTLTESNVTYEVWEPNKKFIMRGDSLPVQLSLLEAFNYCNSRSQMEGYDGFYTLSNDTVIINPNGNGYRLPHYLEWDYAARGGDSVKNYIYSGSNKLKDVAWYAGNSDLKPHNVGQLKPNDLGLYDMSGNSGEFSGLHGNFGYWHTPMFSVDDSYFNTAYPLRKKLSNDEKALRQGVRLILIPKGLKNSNLEIKPQRSHQSRFW